MLVFWTHERYVCVLDHIFTWHDVACYPWIVRRSECDAMFFNWLAACIITAVLRNQIKISEILPWDGKSYLTHAILPRTSSNVIM